MPPSSSVFLPTPPWLTCSPLPSWLGSRSSSWLAASCRPPVSCHSRWLAHSDAVLTGWLHPFFLRTPRSPFICPAFLSAQRRWQCVRHRANLRHRIRASQERRAITDSDARALVLGIPWESTDTGRGRLGPLAPTAHPPSPAQTRFRPSQKTTVGPFLIRWRRPTHTLATLVQVNGLKVLAPVGLSHLATVVVSLALRRRRGKAKTGAGPLAWTVTALLAGAALLGVLSLGPFIVPIVVLLG